MNQETALNILKLGHNVFITGAAGTGKTYVLNSYIDYLKENNVRPAIVAPTGIAASHLNGNTLHSFFHLGLRTSVDAKFLSKLQRDKRIVKKFNRLKVLIVDEISMVSPEIFETMDEILRALVNSFLPFGGLQVILSGDFFQLPPISKKKNIDIYFKFAWQTDVWRELDFRTCYLQDKFRQNDDELITVLDEIRSGDISAKTHDILSSRFDTKLSVDFKPTKLFTHNKDVDKINHLELEKIEEKEHIFECQTKGLKKDYEKIFKNSLLVEKLYLKKDAVVIFIKNNLAKKYINGTIGKVVGFSEPDGHPIVKTSSGLITAEHEIWSLENDAGREIASITQIPLRLAWAITVHKSQGMSLDVAEIDLSKTFEVGQGYVALSRVRTIDGLKLIGLNDMALRVDNVILQIDDRIKLASERAEKEVKKLTSAKLKKGFRDFLKEIKLKRVEKVKDEKIEEMVELIF